MRRFSNCLFLGILVLIAFPASGSAQYSVLHSFAGGADDGTFPTLGGLIGGGSALYGMTVYGGGGNHGVIFKVNTDGSGFELLYEFAGGVDDGLEPDGSLFLDGSTLYGMTTRGGDNNLGVIFKINTDGSGYELLHEFVGGADDGANPSGSIIGDDSALYGMTVYGGDSNVGVIFKINTDGSGYQLLHEFAGGATDGAQPYGSLVLNGSSLYGMARDGGDSNVGVIFKINTDGSGYELLHEFAGGATDGAQPYGSLVLNGSSLYGMARDGGDSYYGVIFKINTDGSGYELLHEFAGPPEDGMLPYGALFSDGFALYGMTGMGGANGIGMVFSLELAQPATTRNIPTLSEWGVFILIALLAVASLVAVGRGTLKSGRTA